jgi:Alpha-mannosidase
MKWPRAAEGWKFRRADGHPYESPSYDDSAWETIPNNHPWDAGTVWLRRWVEIPDLRGGYSFRGGRIEFRLSISNDFPRYDTIYVDGVQRHNAEVFEPILITENAEPGRRYLIAIRTQAPAGRVRFRNASLELIHVPGRPDVRQALTECYVLERINSTSGEGKAERDRILEAALGKIDYTAIQLGDQAAIDASAIALRQTLEPLRPWIKSYTIHGVGNSHIDMAWLWPWTETVEVTRDTFASALQLMHEYPEYYFSFSSVQTYQWIEENIRCCSTRLRSAWPRAAGSWWAACGSSPTSTCPTANRWSARSCWASAGCATASAKTSAWATTRIRSATTGSLPRFTNARASIISSPRKSPGTTPPSSRTNSSGGRRPTAAACSPISPTTTSTK